MQLIFKSLFLCCCIGLFSCQQPSATDKPLSKEDFTPIEKIDPQVYFATETNKANDPNNALTEMFREKKKADMANPAKPRPFQEKDLSSLENISYQQPWTPFEVVFKFDWTKLPEETVNTLSKSIKTRLIFDNADLKVVELAIASGGVLPMHAQPTPSVYHVLGGTGEVLSDKEIATVYPGTSIKFDSYVQKRVKVTSVEPMKILWFSWAPEGNQSYLESGYYLTGSNIHIQPIEAVLSDQLSFWKPNTGKVFEPVASSDWVVKFGPNAIKEQMKEWQSISKNTYYPTTNTFKSAVEVDWVDIVNIDPKSFFFAKDLQKLGSTLDMMGRLAKIKSVFRVNRPDTGYDLNYSYLAWGPRSKYVTHSHAICEFYYLLEGDVEYIIDNQTFHAVPGNFYFHPPYYDHEMRGLKKDIPFLSISGSWIPFGNRALFEQPFYLLEEVPMEQDISFPDDFDFHDFDLNRELTFGVL